MDVGIQDMHITIMIISTVVFTTPINGMTIIIIKRILTIDGILIIK